MLVKWLPWIVCGLHTSLVIAVATLLVRYPSPEGPMVWLGFLYLDFPLSLLWYPIELFRDHFVSVETFLGVSVPYVWSPAVSFALLGGIQYYLLTWFLIKRWEHGVRKNDQA
jgi:hypothetical protein